jgi:hypothetical protein
MELHEISGNGDAVSPESVLEYARTHPKSHLHKCFEWDETKAAHNWHLKQARTVLSCIRKVEIISGGTIEYKREYYNVSGGGYYTTQIVKQRPDIAMKVLRDTEIAIRQLLERFEEVETLIPKHRKLPQIKRLSRQLAAALAAVLK